MRNALEFLRSLLVPMATFCFVFAGGLFVVSLRSGGGARDKVERAASYRPSSDYCPFMGEIPSSWVSGGLDLKSRGWCQTGVIPCSLDDAIYEVTHLMERLGYSVRNKVEDMEGEFAFSLMQFEAVDGDARIWSLSQRDGGHTSFAWGISK